MAIVGFNFTKISGEKLGNITGKININNNVMITDVKNIEVNLGSKGSSGLLVKFIYTCDYAPGIGKINLEGDVVNLEEVETIKKCMDSWKKDKKIDPEITRRVLSHVLSKSTVQAVILSRDIGLPAPIPMPKIESKAAEVKKK
jgi:hypothetical protein